MDYDSINGIEFDETEENTDIYGELFEDEFEGLGETIFEACEEDKFEGLEDISVTSRSFGEDFENPNLFTDNPPASYTYGEDEHGKNAYGSLELTDTPKRNAYNQRTVGGEDRLEDDDGGHLIAARFNGSGGVENLEAQNKNLNRGTYKEMENDWARHLEDGDKVFVNASTYKSNGSDRPDAFYGNVIIEHPDGSRDWDAYSYANLSKEEQAEFESIIEEYDS